MSTCPSSSREMYPLPSRSYVWNANLRVSSPWARRVLQHTTNSRQSTAPLQSRSKRWKSRCSPTWPSPMSRMTSSNCGKRSSPSTGSAARAPSPSRSVVVAAPAAAAPAAAPSSLLTVRTGAAPSSPRAALVPAGAEAAARKRSRSARSSSGRKRSRASSGTISCMRRRSPSLAPHTHAMATARNLRFALKRRRLRSVCVRWTRGRVPSPPLSHGCESASAVVMRRAASTHSMRRTRSLAGSDTSAHSSGCMTKLPARIWRKSLVWSLCQKGGLPHRRMKRITPSDHTSHGGPYSRRSSTSGAT
mmetsp:Transcript_17913/g.60910  ORF Transcript_17913/g.60910 Transcript_17913/m.60910 type:complete len:304 (-) Transcript_17913:443-1354(-)